MEQAEAVNTAYLTEVSAARLEQAMAAAKAAQDYAAVENAISMLGWRSITCNIEPRP